MMYALRPCACRRPDGSLKILLPGETRQEKYCPYCPFEYRKEGCIFEPWHQRQIEEPRQRRRRRQFRPLPCLECAESRVVKYENGRGYRISCSRGVFTDLPRSWFSAGGNGHLPNAIEEKIIMCKEERGRKGRKRKFREVEHVFQDDRASWHLGPPTYRPWELPQCYYEAYIEGPIGLWRVCCVPARGAGPDWAWWAVLDLVERRRPVPQPQLYDPIKDDHRESGIGWKSLLQCALFGVHWAKNIGGECYVCESTIGEDH